MKFKVIKKSCCLYRIDENREVPIGIYQSSFFNVTKTDHELTIICDNDIDLSCCTKIEDLRLIRIFDCEGFDCKGVVSAISGTLTKSDISFSIISSYEANHILVLSSFIDRTVESLLDAGFVSI